MQKKHYPTYYRLTKAGRWSLLSLLLLLFATESLAQVSGYSYRKRLETNNTQVSGTTNLTDFPVLVDLTDADLRTVANGGQIQNSNGYDIVFTGSDGNTVLNHQLESYDAVTGHVVAWVRLPTLQASANTPFYVYYGNPAISTDQSTTNTWSTGYQMVHHYNNNNLVDGTSRGNNGTNNGTTNTTGKVGNGRLFNGNDFISVADNATLDITGDLTLSLWINPTNIGNGPDLISKGAWSDAYSAYLRTQGTVRSTIDGGRQITSNAALANNNWYHVVITKDAGQRNIYINGVSDATSSNTANFSANNDPLYLSSSANTFNGIMDEVRVMNTVPSADWIATEYVNQNNPAGFISVIPEPPVLASIEDNAQVYIVGGAPVNITDSITASDPFYSQLQGATVKITGNYASSEDILSFANTANITSSWDTGSGTLQLSGTAPLSEYQTALRNVTYENSDTTSPDQSTRTIGFTIDNGSSTSDTLTRDLDINFPPGVFAGFTVEEAPSGNITSKTAGENFDLRITAVDNLGDTITTFDGTVVITSTGTLGTGMGTTGSFTNGVLASHTVNIINTGDVDITATNSSGPESGTSNTFTVSPGPASELNSTITSDPEIIQNDGASASTITVQVKDAYGNNLTSGGDTITLNTDNGTLGAVSDNEDGTYTSTLTSSTSQVTATITGTLNGNTISDNAQVEFSIFDAIWQSSSGNPGNAIDWERAQNWSGNSVPAPGDIVFIPSAPANANEFPVIDVNNQTVGSILIEAGADITLTGGISFNITGSLSGGGEINGANNDSVTVGGNISLPALPIGTVVLNGSSKQTVTDPHVYTNLTIDNTAGVDVNDNLFVNNTLVLADGILTIPSGKNLIANNKIIGSGQLAFKRNLSGIKGWRMISSPANTTFGDLLGGTLTQGYPGAFYDSGSSPGDTLQPNVLWYEESLPGTDNQRYRAPVNASDPITAGQGLFVYVFGDISGDPLYSDALPDTLLATGQEHEGDGMEFDFNITYTATADTGWNFVGNPFGASLNWNGPGWTKTNIDNTIYVWDPEANGGKGEYLTWNGSTGTLGSGLIAPFQGFWVKANGPGAVLKVNKSNKTTGGNFLRKTEAGQQNETQATFPLMQFTARFDGLSGRTNLVFQSGAEPGKDINDGFRLLPFSETFMEIYTMFEDGTQLAVNNLPKDFETRMLIPLSVGGYIEQEPISGSVTIIWDGFRNIPNDWILTLVDHQTGNEIDMLSREDYTFEIDSENKQRYSYNTASGTFRLKENSGTSTRFTIRVSTEQIEAEIPDQIYLAQNYPNPFNPATTIEFGLSEDTNVTLEVYDILGRRVRTLVSDRLGAGVYTTSFDARGLASGVYIYRLIAGDRTYVKKFTFIK